MLKYGLIFGIVGFLLTLFFSAQNPVCAICIAIVLGLGAGYLTGREVRPITSQESLQVGAGAGALTGGLMLPGQMIAAVIGASTMDPTGLNAMFGLPASDPTLAWAAQIVVGCCVGLLNVAILTGIGAGGGLVWFQRGGADRAEEPIPPPL